MKKLGFILILLVCSGCAGMKQKAYDEGYRQAIIDSFQYQDNFKDAEKLFN